MMGEIVGYNSGSPISSNSNHTRIGTPSRYRARVLILILVELKSNNYRQSYDVGAELITHLFL